MAFSIRSSVVFVSVLSLSIGFFLGAAVGSVSAGLLGSATFPDIQSDSYYDEAVGEMFNIGIIKGYDDGRFGPNDYVTRGQVAVLMKRLRDELLGNEIVKVQSSSSVSSSSSSSSVEEIARNPAGTVRFTASDYDVDEDAGTASISIIRTGGVEGAVSIKYSVSDGTALRDADYVDASGTLNFADGESSKTFSIEILNDSDVEGDETMNLSLSDPTGGMELGSPNTAVLTIMDEDSPTTSPSGVFNFSAVEYNVAEDGGSTTITVERTGGSVGAVTVNYSTSNGTASSSDYTSASNTLSFADGEVSKTFTVSVTDDSSIDGNKTVYLTLSSPTGGAVLGGACYVLLTIMDDETVSYGTGSLKFSKNSYSATESDGEAVITVKRVGGSNGTVSVTYETIDGTAIASADYTATTGTLTFANGEASKTFVIPILSDTSSDPEETVTVRIIDPTGGATLSTPTQATLTIY